MTGVLFVMARIKGAKNGWYENIGCNWYFKIN
jgi:hypothetical protein